MKSSGDGVHCERHYQVGGGVKEIETKAIEDIESDMISLPSTQKGQDRVDCCALPKEWYMLCVHNNKVK